MKLFLALFFILGLNSTLHSYEKADTFMIEHLSDKIKILSPSRWELGLHLIVKNKSLSRLVAKIETEDGKALKFISVQRGSTVSVELKKKWGRKLFFIPLSPAFPKIKLKTNRGAYEISS